MVSLVSRVHIGSDGKGSANRAQDQPGLLPFSYSLQAENVFTFLNSLKKRGKGKNSIL